MIGKPSLISFSFSRPVINFAERLFSVDYFLYLSDIPGMDTPFIPDCCIINPRSFGVCIYTPARVIKQTQTTTQVETETGLLITFTGTKENPSSYDGQLRIRGKEETASLLNFNLEWSMRRKERQETQHKADTEARAAMAKIKGFLTKNTHVHSFSAEMCDKLKAAAEILN